MAITVKAISQTPKSVTTWIGAAVVLLAYLVGAPHDSLAPLVSVENYEAFLRVAGFILGGGVILNRFFTEGSLESKASP